MICLKKNKTTYNLNIKNKLLIELKKQYFNLRFRKKEKFDKKHTVVKQLKRKAAIVLTTINKSCYV